MGRPKKCDGARPADLQFVDAFWKLLEDHRLHDITVRKVVEAAGLSRATFYYHYKDLDALVDRAIELEFSNVELLTHGIFDTTVGTRDIVDLEATVGSHVRRMALAIDQGGMEEVDGRVKAVVCGMWRTILCPDGSELKTETRVLLEYSVSGNLGMLSFLVKKEAERGVAPGQGERDECADRTVREFLRSNARVLLDAVCALEGISQDDVRERISAMESLP